MQSVLIVSNKEQNHNKYWNVWSWNNNRGIGTLIVGTITGISRIQKSGEQERKGPITETIIRDSRLATRNELRTNTVTF